MILNNNKYIELINYSENQFKNELIKMFNKINEGFVDGDEKGSILKTPDIINESIKIAIEIKDDKISKFCNSRSQEYNIFELNKQFYSRIRDASQKFKIKKYSNYKTILLFRTKLPMASLVKSAINGIHSFEKVTEGEILKPPGNKWIISKGLSYVRHLNTHKRQNIGCFIILNEDGYYYFSNEFSIKPMSVSKKYAEKIFGMNLMDC